MRILMMTNNYTPHTSGLEKSVASFTNKFEQMGHSVLIVAPKSKEPVKEDKSRVIRVSAIKNFNDTNFPVTIPLPGQLSSRLEKFQPEVVHTHFPFIIGSTAIRIAASYEIPLIFTHHTMYERYIHYLNANSDRVRNFVIALTTGYANLCDLVIAPSNSVKQILQERGVKTRIEVAPTGVDINKFKTGNGQVFRKKHNIPSDCFVAGHVGRLVAEKNLTFLTESVIRFLSNNKRARFLIVGNGPFKRQMESLIYHNNMEDQVIFTGLLKGQDLFDAYHSMDVFVFSSRMETQGMVLAEAMAAGLPVVALKGWGVTDILKDGKNGFMIDDEDTERFAQKIEECFNCEKERWAEIKESALKAAEHFSIDKCSDQVLSYYQELVQNSRNIQRKDESVWQTAMDLIKAEWDIFRNYVHAAGDLVYSAHSEDLRKIIKKS